MLPKDSKELMKLLVNQKSSDNASSSQTTAENQNDEKQSQALKAFFPNGTFEGNYDAVTPFKRGSGGTNIMVVPKQPYVDGGGGGDDNSNYKHSGNIRMIETTSVSADMGFSYFNNAKTTTAVTVGAGAVAYTGILLASSQKINGIQQPTYFIQNNPLKVWFGLDVGPHINFGQEVDVFVGGSVVANWTCTVKAKCMTRSIRAQVLIDADLGEILTAMAKAKVLSRFTKFVRGTRAQLPPPVTGMLDNLEVAFVRSADNQTASRNADAADDVADDGADVVRDQQPDDRSVESSVASDDSSVESTVAQLADQVEDSSTELISATRTISDWGDLQRSLPAVANAGKPLYKSFAKAGLAVARRAAGKAISIGNGSALRAVDPLVAVPFIQAVASVVCPALQIANKAKDAVSGQAGLEVGLGCLDENVIEPQVSFTWLNNRWAKNPDGEIQQGWHPKPGDQSPDLFGVNLVLYSTTGVGVYAEWPYLVTPEPPVVFSHRLSLKFRLANPQTVGFFYPLTYNGEVVPK